MIKSAIILFLSLFFVYLPFSRTPDYFDSEITLALIEQRGNKIVASFTEDGKTYLLPLAKEMYKNKLGERVEIRYELNQPEHAKMNKAWGYWWVPSELAFAAGIFIVLMGVAYATTHRPDPASLNEQLGYKKENNTKYM
ncbi:MAG: hypothetical protein RL387_1813 [Bacteroidota bacterium]|jgi:hypothetical protein